MVSVHRSCRLDNKRRKVCQHDVSRTCIRSITHTALAAHVEHQEDRSTDGCHHIVVIR